MIPPLIADEGAAINMLFYIEYLPILRSQYKPFIQ